MPVETTEVIPKQLYTMSVVEHPATTVLTVNLADWSVRSDYIPIPSVEIIERRLRSALKPVLPSMRPTIAPNLLFGAVGVQGGTGDESVSVYVVDNVLYLDVNTVGGTKDKPAYAFIVIPHTMQVSSLFCATGRAGKRAMLEVDIVITDPIEASFPVKVEHGLSGPVRSCTVTAATCVDQPDMVFVDAPFASFTSDADDMTITFITGLEPNHTYHFLFRVEI